MTVRPVKLICQKLRVITYFRWLGFRLEVLGGLVVVIAALFAVLERSNISGSLVGLSISYALQVNFV